MESLIRRIFWSQPEEMASSSLALGISEETGRGMRGSSSRRQLCKLDDLQDACCSSAESSTRGQSGQEAWKRVNKQGPKCHKLSDCFRAVLLQAL